MTPALVPTNQDTDGGVFREAIEQEREEDSPKDSILKILLPCSDENLSRGTFFTWQKNIFLASQEFSILQNSLLNCVEFQRRQSVARQETSAFKQRVVFI